MTSVAAEIQRRENIALEAIKSTFGTEDGEFGATMFATHHIQELESTYWLKHLGTSTPEPKKVLDILQLKSHWGDDENEIEVLDFTLPDDVTDYVMSVRFDETGSVEEVSMES
ncbi:DUF2004 domain-containing protein [Acidovorax kalamii]|uniref:DUF2004 domain-containing protein n=1 Tax=Acidovorax kalamii TaxID=2004485 RepID=A0A235EJU3_9BURK|nr:DUF2004 domain-containing protein [Acidovorax kalamii]OYD48827.1 hypothetical protein CBY09_18625 [Acidovorax kalamii]